MFLGKQLVVSFALLRSLQRIDELEADIAAKNAEANALGEIRKLADVELAEIEKALNFYGRDTSGKQKAAKALGIGIATLYRKINEDRV